MKKPLTRTQKITIWGIAIAAVLTVIGWFIAAHQPPTVKATGQNAAASTNQQGGQTADIIQNASSITNVNENASSITNSINLLTPTPPPEDPIKLAEQKIGQLKPDQSIDYFKAQVGPVFTTNQLTEVDWGNHSAPPQDTVFDEYDFRGSLSSDPSSNDYYIQAVTADGGENVLFWSLTICNPNITFPIMFPSASVTDPAATRTVILNKSTFADIFKITDNPLNEPFSGDTMLYYSPQGESQNIFETQDVSAGENQRLYIGVNNSCQYQNPGSFGYGAVGYEFRNASGTYEPGPQYLENAVEFPGLSEFRSSTVINTIGMSGQDQTFYWFLTSNNADQASMGYDFMTLPGNE